MKTRTTLLSFVLLSSAAGASLADGHIHVYVNCQAADAHCPPPPKAPKPPRPAVPPAPPALPAPPAPPAPSADTAAAAMPAPPAPPAPAAPAALPAPPAPPAPPPAPKIPPVPDSAHADCAAKKPGTRLSFTLRPGETMSGVCRKQGGRMVFSLREYELAG